MNFSAKKTYQCLSVLIIIVFFLQGLTCFYIKFRLNNILFFSKSSFYNLGSKNLIFKECNLSDISSGNHVLCNTVLLDVFNLGFNSKIKSNVEGAFFRIPNEKKLFATIGKISKVLNSKGKYKLDFINFKNCFFQISTPLGFVEFCFNGTFAKKDCCFSKLKIFNLSLNNKVIIKSANLHFKAQDNNWIIKIESQSMDLIFERENNIHNFYLKILDVDLQGYFDEKRLKIKSDFLKQDLYLKLNLIEGKEGYFFSIDDFLTKVNILALRFKIEREELITVAIDGFISGIARYNFKQGFGRISILNKEQIKIKNIEIDKKEFILSLEKKRNFFLLKTMGCVGLGSLPKKKFHSSTSINKNKVLNISRLEKKLLYTRANYDEKSFCVSCFDSNLGHLINVNSDFSKSIFKINPLSVLSSIGFQQSLFSSSDIIELVLNHADMVGKINVLNIHNNVDLNNQIVKLSSDCFFDLHNKKVEFKNALIKFNRGQIIGKGEVSLKDGMASFSSKIEDVIFVNSFFKANFNGLSHFNWKFDDNPFIYSNLKMNTLVVNLEKGKDFFLNFLMKKKTILDQDFLLKKSEKSDAINFYTKIDLNDSMVFYNQMFCSQFDCEFVIQGNFKTYEGLKYQISGNSNFKAGSLNFFDQKFFLKKGIINFDNNSSSGPYFDFNLKTKKDRFDIGAHCFGSKKDFKVSLSSNPFLKEEKIISMICGGAQGESFFQIFPDLVFQGAAKVIDFSNYSSRVKKAVKSIARVCKKIQFVPQFIENKASSIGGGLNLNLNKNISANLKKSFSSQNDLTLNLEYLISDGLSLKFERTPTGNLFSGIEYCLKF